MFTGLFQAVLPAIMVLLAQFFPAWFGGDQAVCDHDVGATIVEVAESE